MRFILVKRTTSRRYVADPVHPADEHIEIVEAVRAREGKFIDLTLKDSLHRREVVADVSRRSVKISAYGTDPFEKAVLTPVAHGEDDIVPGRVKRHLHSVVKRFAF